MSGRNRINAVRLPMLALGILAVSASLATAGIGRTLTTAFAAPCGQAAPARLVGLYAAHFTLHDEQTAGTWHLRIGPRHHLKVWNPRDPVANSPSFEVGPVSFRGDRMIFATPSAESACTVGDTYRWTYRNGLLRFRALGKEDSTQRVLTFTPHAWRRSS